MLLILKLNRKIDIQHFVLDDFIKRPSILSNSLYSRTVPIPSWAQVPKNKRKDTCIGACNDNDRSDQQRLKDIAGILS